MPRVTTIPATRNQFTALPTMSFTKRRTAAYARVSTDSDEQFTSYEAQIDYYTKLITAREDWVFVDVYTDVDTPYGRNTKANQQSILTIHLLFNLDINTSTVSTWPEFDQLMSDGQSQILRLREHVHAYRLRR